MDTFNFPFHTLGVEYPESSAKMTYGRGYEFASKPRGPDQVTLILSYPTLMFYVNPTTGLKDPTINPTYNMAALEEFYLAHKLYEKFIYPHPTDGEIIVRFREPLKYQIKLGGQGAVEPLTLKLLTQP